MTEVPVDTIVRIGQMQARYGHLVDARDWDGLRALFTDDAAFDVSAYGFGRREGIRAIMEFFATARHPAAHHTTNIEVWRDGPTVRSRSKYVVGTFGGAAMGGDYRDVLVETDRGWCFQERVATSRWPKQKDGR